MAYDRRSKIFLGDVSMTVKFSAVPRKDPRDQNSTAKYYATVRSNGRADTHTIAKNINKMSTVSSVDTAAVLEAFLNVVPDELADGNIVELGDFGTFRVSVSSEGAAAADEVTTRSITDVRVLFTPGKRFKQALNAAEFQKVSE
jgi:predicted histone-like DNA-binding protein